MYHKIKTFNHLFTFISAGALIFGTLCACNKLAEQNEPLPEPEPTAEEALTQGSIQLNIDLGEEMPQTKAVASYTVVENYEKAVNRADIFVFHKVTGQINSHVVLNAPTVSDNQFVSEDIPCTTGVKHVYVVVNGGSITGLDSVKTETEFRDLTADLTNNSCDASQGFIMLGRSGDVSVNGAGTKCSVSVRRQAYRVVLQKITNSTALGPVTIKGVFLINAGKVASFAMTNETSLPKASTAGYNVSGKKTGSSAFVTSASTSDVPEMLYADLGSTALAQGSSTGTTSAPLARLYALPHNAHDATPERLVLLATVGGNDYYYPMTLAATNSNQTYTVELTIKNIGSSDPNLPVETGDIDVTVSLMNWVSGTNQEVTI